MHSLWPSPEFRPGARQSKREGMCRICHRKIARKVHNSINSIHHVFCSTRSRGLIDSAGSREAGRKSRLHKNYLNVFLLNSRLIYLAVLVRRRANQLIQLIADKVIGAVCKRGEAPSDENWVLQWFRSAPAQQVWDPWFYAHCSAPEKHEWHAMYIAVLQHCTKINMVCVVNYFVFSLQLDPHAGKSFWSPSTRLLMLTTLESLVKCSVKLQSMLIPHQNLADEELPWCC